MNNNLKEANEDFKQGRFLIITDDEDRENEGDLVIAAEHITKEAINFMITHGKGLVCIAMTGKRLDQLKIPLMTRINTENTRCQFTVSVDHKDVSTGISAEDRELTVKKLIDKDAEPKDFLIPGHVFPLRANDNGLNERQGHTEAAIKLCNLANLYEAAVICEIINHDGTMARNNDLEKFSKKHDIKIIKIKDLLG